MADISYYFKRKYRKGNSESSEDSLKSPEDKKARTIRSPGSESDDILEALDMAEGVMPKIELILSRLAILEDKMDGIEKHMRNVDERVSRLYEKVSTLELCLNGHDELVRSVEAKVTSYIADADKMKSDISTLNKNVKSAEEKNSQLRSRRGKSEQWDGIFTQTIAIYGNVSEKGKSTVLWHTRAVWG